MVTRIGSFAVGLGLAAYLGLPSQALAWGGTGHRTVAAVAAKLLPAAKYAAMNKLMAKLEMDANFVDGASYPDEYVRNHDPQGVKKPWHFADLPDAGSFSCETDVTDHGGHTHHETCLFDALDSNLQILRQGKHDKAEAVALAWVIHLVGDLHQPLHMSGRARGGNSFAVTYRGAATCIGTSHVELHSAWDDCLVGEAADGMAPKAFAASLLGPITSYKGRPEVSTPGNQPWLAWGQESHTLSNDVAFDHLSDGDDLGDAYVLAPNNARDVAKHQLLVAGIRLAYLLDANFR
jgi:hypothetical protein